LILGITIIRRGIRIMATWHDYYDKTYFESEIPEKLTLAQDIAALAKLLPKDTKVLELGCGNGNDSVQLALLRKDLKITAVDFSREGIKKAKTLAAKNSVSVEYRVADFSKPEFEKTLDKYEAIICKNVLSFLPKERVDFVVGMMKRHTKPGGYNAILSFLARDDADKQKLISHGRYKFSPGELLKAYYSDGKVNDGDYREFEEHDGLKPHRHNLVSIISQNPSVV
jgi:2-polyprenyl-3-methyl-5-hydroxy-6-metoxy-1,4-benzoquinol methylase